VGYGGLVWIALAPPLAVWGRRSLATTTALVAACVWTSDLVATAIKATVGRERPFEVVPEAHPLLHGTIGSSFPSGHAATSAAGAVALAVLVGPALPRIVPALAALALAVGFSRVYVGVHYPVDVLAGWAIGAAVASALLLAVRSLLRTSAGRRRSRAAPPPG
jgi:undecaprenyl-diphosphatase